MQKDTRTILLDTRSRQLGSTLTNPVWRLSQLISIEQYISLLSFTGTRADWVFVSGRNTRLRFQEGVDPVISISISQGSYNLVDLLAELSNIMTAASGKGWVYTWTEDVRTNTLQCTGTGAFALLFSNSDSPAYELGFERADTAAALSQTGVRSYNILPPWPICIDIAEVGDDCITSQSAPFNSNFSIAYPATTGDLVAWFAAHPDAAKSRVRSSSNIQQLSLTIRDAFGHVIQPRSDYVILLEFL